MNQLPSESCQIFKPYNQDRMTFLPPSLDELIPQKHLVRVVNEAIERMNLDSILRTYKGGGASSYHPKMILKLTFSVM